MDDGSTCPCCNLLKCTVGLLGHNMPVGEQNGNVFETGGVMGHTPEERFAGIRCSSIMRIRSGMVLTGK